MRALRHGENRPVRGRYAPSPSGDLHLGNARTALIAWWHARSLGGTFVLRMEDLDPDRSKPEAAQGIIRDLYWLGLDWDEGPDVGGPFGPYEQSRRSEWYAEALRSLFASGRVYPCWCTRREVRQAASAPHGNPGGAYRYPGTCRPASQNAWRLLAASPEAADYTRVTPRTDRRRLPAMRFVAGREPVDFVDEFAGPQRTVLAEEVGDFVVRRSDGVAAYHLAVSVDDAEQRISHVVRGDDLLGATACQIEIARALGHTPPRYAHVPLVVDREGRRLAKRKGDLTLRSLREAGVRPEAIVGYLAWTCGLLEKPEPASPRELVSSFALERVKTTPAVVDESAVSTLLEMSKP